MSKVFVVDTYEQPLDPVHPGRARLLLKQGKASVFRRYPFTILVKVEFKDPQVQPLRIKLDPGSRTTGIAIVNDASGEVVFAAELIHRGRAIKQALDDRRAVRHGRRARKTRYRKPRFLNRKNKKRGWLPPSLESRVANVLTWVNRLSRHALIAAISMELVRFDMQLMDNAEISGVEYQQGELQGYEVREYLLDKWGRQCAYCGKKDVPFEVEHIVPRAKGGTDRVTNLTLACEPCNKAKGTQDIAVFLKKKPDVLTRIQAQAKKGLNLKDAAAVNATRWALFERLKALPCRAPERELAREGVGALNTKAMGLPVECGSGGLTKYNRTMRGLPKTHWLDAACVGKRTPDVLTITGIVPLLINATGHGRRQMCMPDKFGFTDKAKGKERHKTFLGYRTGDIVKATTPKGSMLGRIAIRHRPSFRIGKVDVHPKYLHRVHRADGYSYEKGVVALIPIAEARGPRATDF